MTAITVGPSKLKITIDANESAKLFCRAATLTCRDPETQSALRILLGKALQSTDFKLDCKRLYVEMYPSAGGGFIIYFTKTPYRKRYKRNPAAKIVYLLGFSDTNGAIAASKLLSRQSTLKSSLYRYGKAYYLAVSSPIAEFSTTVITEFADSVLCSDTAYAIVSEYGSSVIDENAIEKLSRL